MWRHQTNEQEFPQRDWDAAVLVQFESEQEYRRVLRRNRRRQTTWRFALHTHGSTAASPVVHTSFSFIWHTLKRRRGLRQRRYFQPGYWVFLLD
jgi:hypothetical protein